MSFTEARQDGFPEGLARRFKRQAPSPKEWSRRDWIKLSAASVAAVGLGCLGYGFAVRDHVEISRVPVKIANLPDEFAGLTIAQLSDIHHGLYTGLDYINRCVEIVNGLKPDLIALTGDFTHAGRQYVEPCAELLKNLRAAVGVYAVLGNHDYYAGASRVARALRNADLNLLIDAQDRIEHRGSKLCVIGVDDLYYGYTNIDRLMRDVPKEAPRIVLSHNPDFIEEFVVKRRHIDFMMSGHTHGGQVRFPVLGAPHISSSYGQRYAIGLNRSGSMQVYTTRGIGTVLLPSRFDCPPEIVLYTLERA
ncbi:MAG: metallophosphoesterase [Blastocatellales bacterium]